MFGESTERLAGELTVRVQPFKQDIYALCTFRNDVADFYEHSFFYVGQIFAAVERAQDMYVDDV